MHKRWLARFCTLLVLALLGACAAMPGRDPLRINVVDIDAIEGAGLELRLAVKLRLQNPNESAIEYDGASLELDVNGKTLATGVSDQKGSVPRFGEALLTVPVTISAFNAVRQAMVLADGKERDSLPYVLRGKLAGGMFGSVRFTQEGALSWAKVAKAK
jgi:LEA14-like dessication related protein